MGAVFRPQNIKGMTDIGGLLIKKVSYFSNYDSFMRTRAEC